MQYLIFRLDESEVNSGDALFMLLRNVPAALSQQTLNLGDHPEFVFDGASTAARLKSAHVRYERILIKKPTLPFTYKH